MHVSVTSIEALSISSYKLSNFRRREFVAYVTVHFTNKHTNINIVISFSYMYSYRLHIFVNDRRGYGMSVLISVAFENEALARVDELTPTQIYIQLIRVNVVTLFKPTAP